LGRVVSLSLGVRRLSVALGGRVIVEIDGMALQGPGWIGIIGANGSGKTTLLRALAGRLPVAAGEIEIDGVPCAHDRARRAMWIGFAPEIAALPAELTGCDILSLVARPFGAAIGSPALAPLRAALGVESFWQRRVGTWSAGMRQRLAIYAAFVGGQPIVILDEPFNWLDPVSSFDVKQAIRALAGDSHLIVTALHDIATFTQYCDSGLLLADGRIALALSPDEIAQGRTDVRAFELSLIEQLRPR
jgi:ABC-type multidrug transport system ATPase subunit